MRHHLILNGTKEWQVKLLNESIPHHVGLCLLTQLGQELGDLGKVKVSRNIFATLSKDIKQEFDGLNRLSNE